MDNFIHQSAIVDPKAKIGKNNFIGPYCIIGPNVTIGDSNRFESFVTVGTAAQHREYFLLPPGPVAIGNKNIFREYVTVNGGTESLTKVDNQCTLLIGSHVGHDAHVKDFANLGNNTNLGGHTIVETGANLGLSVVVHQYRIIGAYSMVGMNSTVIKDIMPFVIAHGTPCETKRLNRVGLLRSGISHKDLLVFENWFEDQSSQYENVCSINHFYNKFITEYLNNKLQTRNSKSA